MTVTRERFESGMTYDEYKAQMTRSQERFAENEAAVVIDPRDLAVFKALPQPLNVLVLAEDWCGDVIANLPVLGRLAREAGTLNPRVFLRDQHPDLMDMYLNQGKFRSIPTFVFFDQDFNEIGVFKERPASVTALREARRREIFAKNPEFGSPDSPPDQLPEEVRARLSEATMKMREQLIGFANAAVITELRLIVENGRG
jgi:hypothetical protein